jgi:large subunit ribosomal protein L19
MKRELIRKIETADLKPDVPEFGVGDTVSVLQKVTEGSKTRTQAFEGMVIRRRGSGLQDSFTVRRISFGVGVEKTFPVHSANVQSITRKRRGKVHRARLYYLRTKTTKQARVEEEARK